MAEKRNMKRICSYIIAVFILVIYIVPFWMIFVNSLKTKGEAGKFSLSLPDVFCFSNYTEVFQSANIVRAYLNGILIASGAVILTLLCSSMAAFVIARSKRKVIRMSYYILLLGIVVPVAYIPTYLVLDKLNLLNTYLGIILIHSTYGIPGSMFLYTGFVKTVPRELDEAAIIDGCHAFQMFRKIILPMLKPITMTLFIFNFFSTWNDVQLTLFFTDGDKWTLPLTVYNFYGARSSSWHLIFADIVLTIAPLFIIYLFAQKYIIEGMTAGAVKG